MGNARSKPTQVFDFRVPSSACAFVKEQQENAAIPRQSHVRQVLQVYYMFQGSARRNPVEQPRFERNVAYSSLEEDKLMIFFALPLFMAVLGYLIKVKRWSWLIAGFNTSSAKAKYDEAALCNATGSFLYCLGAVLLLPAIGNVTGNRELINLGGLLSMGLTIGFVIYANIGRRFRRKS